MLHTSVISLCIERAVFLFHRDCRSIPCRRPSSHDCGPTLCTRINPSRIRHCGSNCPSPQDLCSEGRCPLPIQPSAGHSARTNAARSTRLDDVDLDFPQQLFSALPHFLSGRSLTHSQWMGQRHSIQSTTATPWLSVSSPTGRQHRQHKRHGP